MAKDARAKDFPFLEGRVFKNEPGHDVRERFLKFVHQTAHPETFKGLCTYPVSGDEPYQIITKFNVDSKKRPNGENIACAICRPSSPKFLNGALVYHPSDKKIRLIGHTCADSHHTKKAEEEYAKKIEKWKNEEFLLNNYDKVPQMVAAAVSATPTFLEADRLSTIIRSSKINLTIKRLRRLQKEHGNKLVVEADATEDTEGPQSFKSSTGETIGHFIEVGTLYGDVALRTNYRPANQISDINFALAQCNFGCGDDAFMKIAELSEEHLKLAVIHTRQAHKNFLTYQAKLFEFAKFFTHKNFEQLNKWGQHEFNDKWIKATVSNNLFEIHTSEREHLRIKVDAVLFKTEFNWPTLEYFHDGPPNRA